MVISDNSILPGLLRTVFLDRDGVLNEKMPEGCYVSSWNEFHPLPGAVEAISRLNRAGLRVMVVSNQRGIAKGLYTAADVQEIHSRFQNLLKTHGAKVDGFYFCPHEKGQCNCRKPLPGLYEHATRDFPGISGETSAMIGDSISDIEFGRRLGMRTVFLDRNGGRQKPDSNAAEKFADLWFSNLPEAVDALLENL